MSVVALCSAHGAPGVTTAVLVLAAAWPPDRGPVVVEADPSGGVLAARFGIGDTPGLASLAVAGRGGITADHVADHTQMLPGGLAVIVGPPAPEQAATLLPDVTPVLVAMAAERDVLVDCGRVLPPSPATGVLQATDVVLLVVRPSADQLRPAAHRIHTLAAAGVEVSLLCVGDSPYPPEEVASTLGVEVAGVLAWDPRTADAICGTATPPRSLRRMPLARSAATMAERLVAALDWRATRRDTREPVTGVGR